jgi:GT2 family glycosyltransferase
MAVVPVRNRKAITLRFLEQMAQQTYPALRLVVVDANSSDGTAAAVGQRFPAVTLLAAGDRDFWAGATNRGVRHALAQGADYILTINDDAVVEPDHVARLVALAHRHGCAILGNQINYLADRDRLWGLGTFTAWGTPDFLRLAHAEARQADLPLAVAQAEVLPVEALPGNGVLLHHSVYRRVGLYNAALLPHYHADSELIMRAVGRGIAAYVTPQVVLYNDFSARQKRLPLGSLGGLLYSLGHPKSHLYLPAVAYIFARYCPTRHKLATLRALGRRFVALRS